VIIKELGSIGEKLEEIIRHSDPDIEDVPEIVVNTTLLHGFLSLWGE